tara:strand:+ start:501 stop:2267 length:1767 start_codon:yes stop_codon:yes gene_type:complete
MTQYSIRKIILENFKSYLESTEINFGSKITLIFGKGSVGKSTIIDALQLLHSSHINNVDLIEKNSRYLVSKFSKSNNFTINLTCAENRDGLPVFPKSIKKKFLDSKNGFFPETIELYADEETNPDKKFLTISNEILPQNIDKDKNLKDFLVSKISFIENKYAYKELYKYSLQHKSELIKNLNKCLEFSDSYYQLAEDAAKAKKENKIDEAEKIENKMKGLFGKDDDEPFELSAFRPYDFPFGVREKITKHIKFLEDLKNNEIEKFINYIADDVKKTKTYLYKNNKIYTDGDFQRTFREQYSSYTDKLFKHFKKRVPSIRSSLLEFLCYCLTNICVVNKFDPFDPKGLPPIFASKDSFQWKEDTDGKGLSPREMMRLCNRTLSQTLKQIKTIRHQENINNIVRSLNVYSSNITSNTDFHEQVDLNAKTINKWLSKFEYDFKINVERSGPKGEGSIWHSKGKHKIPHESGGSGAQFLLTYLNAIIDSKENTILLEEPEKALHASLQIKLAEFFAEMSNQNQLIIETHSENLLLGILKQVREKKIKPHEITVLYVHMENGISKVDTLELNEKGGFKSKWRDGFFTEKLDLL